MTLAFVSVGSNIDRSHSIRSGLSQLRKGFGELRVSTVYESRAYGFRGENFYNLVVGLQTRQPPAELVAGLHAIENDLGRSRSGNRFSSRRLDLDLLLYGDLVCHDDSLSVPRRDIVEYAFVLRPLSDIAGDLVHPEYGMTIRQLWQGFDDSGQETWAVEFKLEESE